MMDPETIVEKLLHFLVVRSPNISSKEGEARMILAAEFIQIALDKSTLA